MNEENPVVRQVANVITTLGFFALLGFLALHQSLHEQSIAWILGAFTVGTSGTKISKHVSTGLSVARMRAVRPHRRDDGPPEGGGRADDVHTHVTRQVERVDERVDQVAERQTGPGPYGPRGRGPGGIIRRIIAWSPTILAGVLAAVTYLLTREPVAIAAPVDPDVQVAHAQPSE